MDGTNVYDSENGNNFHELRDEDYLLSARDLCVEYSFNSGKRLALNGLTFHIKKGERVALLGNLKISSAVFFDVHTLKIT
jgi:ABC-type transport system involved in cytochrome bd biosynthesis fused ATPase/permease subunit